MSNVTGAKGPGLAKARAFGLWTVRSGCQVRSVDAAWRDLFAAADMISEGAVRQERDVRTWYGSTSLILPLPGVVEMKAKQLVSAVAGRDLHVRLRALRAARREAASRAPAALGPSRCEMRFNADLRGLRIDVDVQAPLIEDGRLGTGVPRA